MYGLSQHYVYKWNLEANGGKKQMNDIFSRPEISKDNSEHLGQILNDLDDNHLGKSCQLDLKLRHEFKYFKTPQESLDLILLLNSQLPENIDDLTDDAKFFYYKCIKPIISCFKNHFNERTDAFLQKWGSDSFDVNTFGFLCQGNPESLTCPEY